MTSEPNPITSVEATRSIAVAELADELGTYKQTIFKIAKRLNLQAMKRREPTRGNQLIALVSEADAAAIRDAFAQGRRSGIQGTSDIGEFAPDEGWFYLIQLEPEHDPGRFKVGFTTPKCKEGWARLANGSTFEVIVKQFVESMKRMCDVTQMGFDLTLEIKERMEDKVR